MRRWYVPLTVLGIGSMGVWLAARCSKPPLRWFRTRLPDGPARLADWNDAAQRELEHIQTALNQVSESLHAGR